MQILSGDFGLVAIESALRTLLTSPAYSFQLSAFNGTGYINLVDSNSQTVARFGGTDLDVPSGTPDKPVGKIERIEIFDDPASTGDEYTYINYNDTGSDPSTFVQMAGLVAAARDATLSPLIAAFQNYPGEQGIKYTGSPGWDQAYSSPGDDVFDFGSGTDRFNMSEGRDKVTGAEQIYAYDVGSPVHFTLATGLAVWGTTPFGEIGLHRTEFDSTTREIVGSPFDDVMKSRKGTGEVIILNGWKGNDTITSYDGPDRLFGGPGKDRIFGNDGKDFVLGGNDDDRILGGGMDDTLKGQNGADTIIGGPGNDRIEGGARGDTLDGNKGDDTILGGDGVDTIRGGPDKDRIEGNDNGDKLFGGAQDDIVLGNLGDDRIFGGFGKDTLLGHNGKDEIHGGKHNDTLQGGAHADKLFGGEHDDTLWGGGGIDILTGGPGIDRFVFRRDGSPNDRITDFNPAFDIIQTVAKPFATRSLKKMGADTLLTIKDGADVTKVTFENIVIRNLGDITFEFI